jgi:hypothetical protein
MPAMMFPIRLYRECLSLGCISEALGPGRPRSTSGPTMCAPAAPPGCVMVLSAQKQKKGAGAFDRPNASLP